MAYSNTKTITVDNTKVSGSVDLSNFPMLFSGTYAGTGEDPDLRITGSGGDIQNEDTTGGISGSLSVPADLEFTSDEAGTTQLDHEIVHWDKTTGQIVAYVRIPTLAYSSDTVIYLQYNDSAVTTSQENINGVWETNYKGVWHLSESSGTRYDSSGNSNDLTDNNTVTGATGKIHNASDFTRANSEYLSITDASQTGLDLVDLTMSVWINLDQLPSDASDYLNLSSKSGDPNELAWMFGLSTADKGYMFYSGDGDFSPYSDEFTNAAVVDTNDVGNWVHLSCTVDGSNAGIQYYKNGSSVTMGTSGVSNANTINDSAADFKIGQFRPSDTDYFDGQMEEMRIYSGFLSSGWITTEYNNQNSPSTFYSVEDIVGGGGLKPPTMTFGNFRSPTF